MIKLIYVLDMTILQQILTLIISLSTVFGIFTGVINWLFNKKLDPIKNENLRNQMETWRYTVVSFASDLHNGIIKTKFEYEAIFVFIDNYEDAIERLKVKNTVFEEEVIYIKEKYHELIGIK